MLKYTPSLGSRFFVTFVNGGSLGRVCPHFLENRLRGDMGFYQELIFLSGSINEQIIRQGQLFKDGVWIEARNVLTGIVINAARGLYKGIVRR